MNSLPKKILVIDDSVMEQKILRIYIEKSGYECEVLCAKDGEEGIQIAENISPDLIILDIEMPGIDGTETLYRLRKNPRTESISVVMFTGTSDTEITDKCTALGVLGFLKKPHGIKQINDLIKTIHHEEGGQNE
jgi:CheY-like chemotaxis protein